MTFTAAEIEQKITTTSYTKEKALNNGYCCLVLFIYSVSFGANLKLVGTEQQKYIYSNRTAET